jgi:hypothetical protein
VKRRLHSGFVLAGLILATVALGQKPDQGTQLRTVHGIVVDKDENGIASAIVYLEDLSSKTIKSHISDSGGHFTYSGLNPNVDYELHAEHGDMTSSTHRISSFDTRREVNIELKIDRKKPAK